MRKKYETKPAQQSRIGQQKETRYTKQGITYSATFAIHSGHDGHDYRLYFHADFGLQRKFDSRVVER